MSTEYPTFFHPATGDVDAYANPLAAMSDEKMRDNYREMFAGAMHARRELIAITAQRDELLAALKYHQEQTRPIQRTIDVIAKCEVQP